MRKGAPRTQHDEPKPYVLQLSTVARAIDGRVARTIQTVFFSAGLCLNLDRTNMLLQPDVWVRLRASTAEKMPDQLMDAVRSALTLFDRTGLRVVCADSTDWASSADTSLDWPRSGSNEHVPFVIVGVVLNGPLIAQAIAAGNAATLSLIEEAAAHLVEGGIAVNGMAFGRQQQMTSANDIHAWLSTLLSPNHARACLDTPTLEQS